jgi:general secretion pathway protein G
MASLKLRRRTIVALAMICIVLIGVGLSVPLYVRSKRINSVNTTLSRLERAICRYAIDNDELPTTKEGLEALLRPPSGLPDDTTWQGPYLGKFSLPCDAWGRGIEYERLDPDKFRVHSRGPDGIPNTYDDIEMVGSRTQCSPPE